MSARTNGDGRGAEAKTAPTIFERLKCTEPQTEEELRVLIASLKGRDDLPFRAKPKPPMFSSTKKTPAKKRLARLQRYIDEFQYNHTGTRYFRTPKHLGFKRMVQTAKSIMHDALPIQCLEATFLSAFLTCSMIDLERIPVSFKSYVNGRMFRHIILAVRSVESGLWGAMGISRKATLAYRPLEFEGLGSLIYDFVNAYETCWHSVKKVYVGFPFPHDAHSSLPHRWRAISFRLDASPKVLIADLLDDFGRNANVLMGRYYKSEESERRESLLSKYRLNQGKDDESDDEDDGNDENLDDREDASSIPTLPKIKSKKGKSSDTIDDTLQDEKRPTSDALIQSIDYIVGELRIEVDNGQSRVESRLESQPPQSTLDEIDKRIPPTPALASGSLESASFLGV